MVDAVQWVCMSFSPFDGDWFGSGSDISADRSTIAGNFEGDHILVPLLTPTVPAITDQIKVAATLARVKDASLRIINPIRAPSQTPHDQWSEIADRDDHGLLSWALDEAITTTPEVQASLFYSRTLMNAVSEAIARYEIDTLVLPSTSSKRIFGRKLSERLSTDADCDVIVVNGQPGFETVPSILLPIAGGPHSGLAADVAQAIAVEYDAWIDILHVVGTNPSRDRETTAHRFVDAAFQRIARPETTTTWILEADDAAEAIVEQSQYYDLTVLGAPTVGKLRQLVHSSTNQRIRDSAQSVVLSARNNRHHNSLLESE